MSLKLLWLLKELIFSVIFTKVRSPNSEETICSYCIFGSTEKPKYVAAIPHHEMKCQVICDGRGGMGPQCYCHNKYATIHY